MTFMIIDIDNYNILLSLDFLIEFNVIVDAEKWLSKSDKG
jgi:hypothetical protein